ncbi:MAG TPA: bifunctional 4-hydroxy-2-oxoglutarate aldolase/2-dehydro-3-deoxy-phosphogluconate aldolase [Solirubrobacteraceae bacterium]|jgi:2-dehydro-3-deoxyphosphogluconate aldolase/(4S)-4-hydroxy-2-oxoglutarate aldolase|nr:bifunctional 4-hydroxy-2-oxoglutarate aldolase/2-dehydro-3-deoxy-phosphogluconate aldolase [Solirubrobacteraceae bacterium]
MSARPPSVPALLADRRIVVVVRHDDAAVAEDIARAAADGGLRAVEITMSVPGAAALIAELRASLASDVLVGAGTVLSAQQLEAVLAADAQFVVAPGLDRAIVQGCAAARVAVLPGALTPTEVTAARALGLDAVKLFPSDSVGPAHLRALRSVFADVAFVPTGGVTSANAAAWFDAGARALGLAGEFDAAHRAGGTDAVRGLARQLREVYETRDDTHFIQGAPR